MLWGIKTGQGVTILNFFFFLNRFRFRHLETLSALEKCTWGGEVQLYKWFQFSVSAGLG